MATLTVNKLPAVICNNPLWFNSSVLISLSKVKQLSGEQRCLFEIIVKTTDVSSIQQDNFRDN
jgi:hypothetical protein